MNYDNKHIISINFSEKTLKFLWFLKKEHYIKSISGGVRELVSFGLPFFLNVNNIIDKSLEKKIKDVPYRETKPILTLTELRKKYPEQLQFKNINEVK